MRALVIDDSRAMRAILRKIMSGLGFTVTEAANGREGLERLREHGPADIAMVDWNLPVMNGFDFVLAVRSEAAFGSMRLMMVTTETEQQQVRRALEAGADEYLMKPFSADIVREKLELLDLHPEVARDADDTSPDR
jgi:two-component system chemotaxis response regulator CheY